MSKYSILMVIQNYPCGLQRVVILVIIENIYTYNGLYSIIETRFEYSIKQNKSYADKATLMMKFLRYYTGIVLMGHSKEKETGSHLL